MEIAWGKNVGKKFKTEVVAMSGRLGCDPSHLMSAMAFETGERFSSSVQHPVPKATGLIQFMPATAKSLGTTTNALRTMGEIQQLEYVERYLAPFKGRMKTLSDVYMTILWPAAVGKPEAHVLFRKPKATYNQNKGLDASKDGQVTKGEAAAKVQAKLIKGLGKSLRG